MSNAVDIIDLLSRQQTEEYSVIQINDLYYRQFGDKYKSSFSYYESEFYSLNYYLTADCSEIYSLCEQIESKLNIAISFILSADRRYSQGRDSKYTYDPFPTYSLERQKRYVCSLYKRISTAFSSIKPDLAINFGSSNVSDLLLEYFAKSEGIPFKQIKSAKLSNFVSANPSGTSYNYLVSTSFPIKNPDLKEVAEEYVTTSRLSKSVYEGSIHKLSSDQNPLKNPSIVFHILKSTLSTFLSYFRGDHLSPHYVNQLKYSTYVNLLNPIRAFHYLSTTSFLSLPDLARYKTVVFFPLHYEPEVSLSIYGTACQNQFHVLQQISLSLPHSSILIVKEHPRSIGQRPASFYKQLSSLPNLAFVDPRISSTDVLNCSSLVSVISSSVSTEAICKQIPVIHFGEIPLQGINDSMVLHAHDTNTFKEAFNSLSSGYRYDHSSLITRLTNILSLSQPINLYTQLLRKSNRFQTPTMSLDTSLARLRQLLVNN